MKSTWPNGFDQAALDWMVSIRTEALTAVVRVVTTMGSTAGMCVVTAAAIGWLVYRRSRSWAWCVGLTTIAAFGVMNLLKWLFGRERPPTPLRIVDIGSASFPSGHALVSAAVLGIVAVAIARRRPALALLSAVICTFAIGMSRVYLGAHWMTDVLAGWVVGSVVVWCAVWLHQSGLRAAVTALGRPALQSEDGGADCADSDAARADDPRRTESFIHRERDNQCNSKEGRHHGDHG